MMPGETQSRTAGTPGSCQNCSVLQQSLNEYMDALLALKQKIIDTDHLLTEYQQKCDELQITERENGTLRHQLEQMLQSILPQEKCQEELESMKAELEEKKSSLKMYQEGHLEYIRIKEECDRSDAVKKKLETKLKKLEDTTEKQNQDVKQLKMEKKVLERELKKTQEKLEGFQKKSHKKTLKHVQTQVSSEEPVVKVDKRKIKQLLEELWECIDSATERKQNKDYNHFLVPLHGNSRTPEQKRKKFIREEKVSKKHDKPMKSDACIVAPSHYSPLELFEMQKSTTAHQIKKDSEPHKDDPISLSNKCEGEVEDCNGDSAFYEAQTLDISVQRNSTNSSSDSDQKDENYLEEKLLEVMKWVKPLPPLLSPVQFSASVIQSFTNTDHRESRVTTGDLAKGKIPIKEAYAQQEQSEIFGELTDSSDEEPDHIICNVEDLPDSNISESWNNLAFLTVNEHCDNEEQLSEMVHDRNSNLEENKGRLITSDSLAVTMAYIKERENKASQISEAPISTEHISASADLIMHAEPMEDMIGILNKTHTSKMSHLTEIEDKSAHSEETALANEEVIACSGSLIRTLDESVQSEQTDFTNGNSKINLEFLKEKLDESLKHLQKTSNKLMETEGKYVSSKLENPKSNHTEERDGKIIQTEETILLSEFVLRNHESCDSIPEENVQAKLYVHKLSPKEKRNYEPILSNEKGKLLPFGKVNQEHHAKTTSEPEKNEERGPKRIYAFDLAPVLEGDSIIFQNQCESMQAGDTDIKFKSVSSDSDHFEGKFTEALQSKHEHLSDQLEITNAERKVVGKLDVILTKCESAVSVMGRETESKQNEKAANSGYTCATAEQLPEKDKPQKSAEMTESNKSMESRHDSVKETDSVSKNITAITNASEVIHAQHSIKVKEFLESQDQGSIFTKSVHDLDKERKPLQMQGADITVHILLQKDKKKQNAPVESEATVILHDVSGDRVLATEDNCEVMHAQRTCIMSTSGTKSGIETLESDVGDEYLMICPRSLPEESNEQLKTKEVIVERIPAVESEHAAISHTQSFVSDVDVCVRTENSQIDRKNVELNKLQSRRKLTHSFDLDKDQDIVDIGLGHERSTIDHPEQTHDFSDENKLVFSENRTKIEQSFSIPLSNNEVDDMSKEESQSGTEAFHSEDTMIATNDDSLHNIQSVSVETLKSCSRGTAITADIGWVDGCCCSRETVKESAYDHLLRQQEESPKKSSATNKFRQLNSSPGCKGDSELETENGSSKPAVTQEPQKSLRKHNILNTDFVCCDAKDHTAQMHIDPIIVRVKDNVTYEQNTKELIDNLGFNTNSVGIGLMCTSPLNGNQMKEYNIIKSVLECTENAKVKKESNQINTSVISSEKQFYEDLLCERLVKVLKETECDDLEEENYPLRKVNYASHLKKCSLVTEEKTRTTSISKMSEFQAGMNLTISGCEIPSSLSTDNLASTVQEITISSETPHLLVNEFTPIMEVCGHKEINVQDELGEKPSLGVSDVLTLGSTVENIQTVEHKELSNVTKHAFDDINASLQSVELSVALPNASVKGTTNQDISEASASLQQVLQHSKMKNELLINSKSVGLILIDDRGEEKLKSNTGKVIEDQTFAKITDLPNADCERELNNKHREAVASDLRLQAKHDIPLSNNDGNHGNSQKGFHKTGKIRNFDKCCIWNLPRTDEKYDPRAVNYIPDKHIFEETCHMEEVESFGDVVSKSITSSGFNCKNQEQANSISNISTKMRGETNRDHSSGKVPQRKGKAKTLHGQGNKLVLANVVTSTARNLSPDTLSKVRSEMGPPLPPLLPPLMATPPRNLHSVMRSTSNKLSVPSPLDDSVAPLCETPLPPLVPPLSDHLRYKSPVLKTPSPSGIVSRGILSSPLQFCSATPKHALPVPGRLPPSAATSSVSGIPQENSVKILDTMYPELSARARTLNILKGNIQLNRCGSVDCKSLPGPVNEIIGFKTIISTSTAFIKTGNNSNNDISKDRTRDFECVQVNSLNHNCKRSLHGGSLPKSAKRLRLDSESPSIELINNDAMTGTIEKFDSRLHNDISSTTVNGSIHHKQTEESGSELLPFAQESDDPDKEAVTNALKTIGESCFDLLPVIHSHIFVGNISKVPVMRDEEKQVVYEFTVSKKNLAEALLCSIINKLKTEMMSLDHCYLQALCRVYVGICRQLGDLERARLFCYSILKEGFPESEKLTLFIISVWHDIFALQGVINKAMQSVIKHRAKREVLSCLSSYLNWEKSPPLNIGIILSSLLMAIELCPNVKFQLSEQFGEDLSDTMWEYLFAIDLLCCHRKWVWTHDNVISKELWPIMDKWVKHRKGRVNIASTPNIIVAAVLRLIGRLSQIGLKEGYVSAVKNISSVIGAFVQHAKEEDVPWGVQLASVYALYDLAPSDPVGILETLQDWRTGASNSIPPAVTNCITGIRSLCVQN